MDTYFNDKERGSELMGFNVAMDFHPWILGTDHFQFPNFFFASMLPWIFIHGYLPAALFHSSGLSCFNVAMDFHPWILVLFLFGLYM